MTLDSIWQNNKDILLLFPSLSCICHSFLISVGVILTQGSVVGIWKTFVCSLSHEDPAVILKFAFYNFVVILFQVFCHLFLRELRKQLQSFETLFFFFFIFHYMTYVMPETLQFSGIQSSLSEASSQASRFGVHELAHVINSTFQTVVKVAVNMQQLKAKQNLPFLGHDQMCFQWHILMVFRN